MPSRRTCPACAKAFQKGVRALFCARTGPRMATVCQKCAAGGVLMVQDHTGDVTRCVSCEKHPAVHCSVCVVKASTEFRKR